MGRSKRVTRSMDKLEGNGADKKRRTGEAPKLAKTQKNIIFAESGMYSEERAVVAMGGTILAFENMKRYALF